MTEDEYLALEDRAEEKHEFINGEMVAMAGVTLTHNVITVNLAGELVRLLKGQRCIVLANNQRVNVDATSLYTYPDVIVVCGRARYAPKSRITITNPLVLIEVLSESTEAYDRGAKFAHYRLLPSLQAYVLVAQHPRRVEVFQRMPEGGWLLNEAEQGAIRIPCLDVALDLDEVYRNLELLQGEDEDVAEDG